MAARRPLTPAPPAEPTGAPPMTVGRLLQLESRGEIKRWGAWLDGEGAWLRDELVSTARARGVDLDDVEDLSGKHLLRRCLDRAEEAQVRRNPIARDEAFVCVNCAGEVPAGGRRPRDHCPFCLHGRHVDADVPGDRASTCGGLLVPIGVEPGGDGLDLLYRCATCGALRKNRVLDDVIPPDDPELVRRLSGAGGAAAFRGYTPR